MLLAYEGADGQARIEVDPGIVSGVSAAWDHVRYSITAIDGGVDGDNYEDGNCSSNIDATLAPVGSSRFIVQVGLDSDNNGILSRDEVERQIYVDVVPAIYSLSFAGTGQNTIKKDSGTDDYSGRQWVDGNTNLKVDGTSIGGTIDGDEEHQYPVSYVRGSAMQMTAKFLGSLPSGTVVSAVSPYNGGTTFTATSVGLNSSSEDRKCLMPQP